MTLWKSPVLYFGILLVAAVAALLLAPFVVDWNQYRTTLENAGARITGREVKIGGPVEVRLFPWPRLSLYNISIANAPAARDPHVLTAERADVRITIGGLFGGELNAENISVVKPVLTVERFGTGEWNWHTKSRIDPALRRMLARLRLENIRVEDGTIRLIDKCRGGEALIEHVNATLSAPGFAGPWRAQGHLMHGARAYTASLLAAEWDGVQPFRFSLRGAPEDGNGLAAVFDGSATAASLSGALKVEAAAPPAPPAGKTDRTQARQDLVLKAKLRSQGEGFTLSDVEVAPRDGSLEGANLLTGSATLRLCPSIELQASLAGPKLDLNQLIGTDVRAAVAEGAFFTTAGLLLREVPAAAAITLEAKTPVLMFGDEIFKDASLRLTSLDGQIRVDKAAARLPGQTDVLFSGVLVRGEGGPQLSGDFAAESLNLRDFARWARPAASGDIDAIWTGSRGRMKAQGQFDAVPGTLRVTGGEFQLDASQGRLDVSVSTGPEAGADIRLEAGSLDLDLYAPKGIGAVSAGGWQGLLELLPGLARPRSFRLLAQLGEVKLNGVTAEDVSADLLSSAAGLDLRQLDIGKIGEARVTASGLIKAGGRWPEGSIKAEVKAAHPRDLLRLLGAIAPGPEPAWAGALGETAIDVSADFEPDGLTPGVVLRGLGRSGDFTLDSEFAMQGDLDWRKAEISAAAELATAESESIASLAGLASVTAANFPARLTASATGSLADGIVTDLTGSLFGAKLRLQGRLAAAAGEPQFEGRASLSSERPVPLYKALGLPAIPGGLFSAEADILHADGTTEFKALRGIAAGGAFSGELQFASERTISGNLALEQMRLADLLTLSFLPWNGRQAEPDAPFAASPPFGLQGEVWIRPGRLELIDGVVLTESETGIKLSPEETLVSLFGKNGAGENVSFEVAATPSPGGKQIRGQLTLPLDLAQHLKARGNLAAVAGRLTIDGAFRGEGRSPAGVLASLSAAGSYQLKEGMLAHFAPGDFLARATAAASTTELEAAVASIAGSETGIPLGDASGTITVAEGIAALLPLQVSTPDANLTIKPFAELATGTLDIGIAVALKQEPPLPGFEIAYAGPPHQLERSTEASALVSGLGFKLLQKGVVELERIQAEQKRAFEADERLRREDEARLAAWQAHRREMLMRRRELSVHRQLAEAAAIEEQAAESRRRAQELAAVKQEMTLKQRQQRLHRLFRTASLRKIKPAAPPKPAAVARSKAAPVKPAPVKPKPLQLDDLGWR